MFDGLEKRIAVGKNDRIAQNSHRQIILNGKMGGQVIMASTAGRIGLFAPIIIGFQAKPFDRLAFGFGLLVSAQAYGALSVAGGFLLGGLDECAQREDPEKKYRSNKKKRTPVHEQDYNKSLVGFQDIMAGSVKQKVEPWPGWDSTQILPP